MLWTMRIFDGPTFVLFNIEAITEMEYCASAASMLTEEIWQIAKEIVEDPANL